jgi:hydrogenase maturation protease
VSEAPPLFVGIGDPSRRDDGVGPWLAEALSQRGCNTAHVARDGAALATLLDGQPAAILLDATNGAGEPGTLTMLDLRQVCLPVGLSPVSTHIVGLAEGVEMLRALEALPSRLRFVGIEGEDFGYGDGLTPKVEGAARALLPRLQTG